MPLHDAFAVPMRTKLPFLLFDPDGERLPKWVQFISVPLNSLVWGMAILLVAGLIERVVRESWEHVVA